MACCYGHSRRIMMRSSKPAGSAGEPSPWLATSDKLDYNLVYCLL